MIIFTHLYSQECFSMCVWCQLFVKQQISKDTMFCTALWCWSKCTCPCVFTGCVGFRLGSADCHGNHFWVFWLVVGVELKWWRLSGSIPSSVQNTMQTACFIFFILVCCMQHPGIWPQVIIIISFDIIVRILWLQLFVMNCHLRGPCNFHSFLGKCPQLQLQPPLQPNRVLVAHAMGHAVVKVLILYDSEYIRLVRYLNKNAFVKSSLQWNIQVLIFFPQVQRGKLLSGLSIYVTVAALLWPFLFKNPLRAFISLLFHMYATEVRAPTTQQNKSSTVRATHSWASDITWSTVWPLCFLCFTLSLTEEEDRESTSQSKTCACLTWTLMGSSECVRLLLCVCAHVRGSWALLTEGSISSPSLYGSLAGCEAGVFTPLSADCEGLAHEQDDFWLQVWNWYKWKKCVFSLEPFILPSLIIWYYFLTGLIYSI